MARDRFSDALTDKEYEFGGPLGVLFIIIFAHFLVYYLWISMTYYQGGLLYPSSLEDSSLFFSRMWQHIVDGASPTSYTFVVYIGFFLSKCFLPGACQACG